MRKNGLILTKFLIKTEKLPRFEKFSTAKIKMKLRKNP